MSGQEFTQLVIMLSQCLYTTRDQFFRSKLFKEIQSLLEEIINKQAQEQNTLFIIGSIIYLLESLDHLGLANKKQIALAHRLLLKYKLELLQAKKKIKPQPKKNIAPKIETDKVSLNSTQEKILNFIKRSNHSRTKDIINEFSLFSERTVKRNLKELLSNGFLIKRTQDNGTYYTPKG